MQPFGARCRPRTGPPLGEALLETPADLRSSWNTRGAKDRTRTGICLPLAQGGSKRASGTTRRYSPSAAHSAGLIAPARGPAPLSSRMSRADLQAPTVMRLTSCARRAAERSPTPSGTKPSSSEAVSRTRAVRSARSEHEKTTSHVAANATS
eukprot:scaffold7320_cov139-Isochrysis_galbana.AAC.5